MHKHALANAVLLAAAAPALADLTVDQDLGTQSASGTSLLGNTTVGQTSDAATYSSTTSTSIVWANGEYVYQFALTKPAFLYLENTAEPDADGAFPDPDHDYFLTNTLTTAPVAAPSPKANNPNLVGQPQATSLALVAGSVGPTTAGSNANIGAFRSAASNPLAIYGAGTYYVSVDARRNPTAPSPQPPGRFSAELNVAYLDEVQTPDATPTEIDPDGQITGDYNPEDVLFFEFDYAGGTGFSVSTNGSTLSNFDDTFLALYNSAGGLVAFNDETTETNLNLRSTSVSRIVVADDSLPADTYYLGFISNKPEANPAFDLSVFGDSTVSGTFVINGLSVVPEPSSLALAAVAVPLVLRRRRR